MLQSNERERKTFPPSHQGGGSMSLFACGIAYPPPYSHIHSIYNKLKVHAPWQSWAYDRYGRSSPALIMRSQDHPFPPPQIRIRVHAPSLCFPPIILPERRDLVSQCGMLYIRPTRSSRPFFLIQSLRARLVYPTHHTLRTRERRGHSTGDGRRGWNTH